MEPDEFDLAGFCIGVGERSRLLDGQAARAGDAIVGLASSGLHANGYSLVRALVAEHGLAMDKPYAELVRRTLGDAAVAGVEPELAGLTLGDVLLTPTRIYAKDLLGMRADLDAAGFEVRGMAHVTGGGLPGNVPRAFPEHLGARIHTAAWPMPSIMRVLGVLGDMADPELRATFNGGLGMVVVVPAGAATATMALARARRIPAWIIGEVVDAASIGGRYQEEGSAR